MSEGWSPTSNKSTYDGDAVIWGMWLVEVRVEVSQIEAVERIELPKTKEVRTFLDLTGYYRRFVPDYILDHGRTSHTHYT